MQLPASLQAAIDHILEKTPPATLRKARASLTQNYREGGSSPFSDEAKLLAYLGARMPATYAAIRKVLQQVVLSGHLLDLGAGPGTASWAATDLFPDLQRMTLIEQNADAIQLGRALAQFHPTLRQATWLHQSLEQTIPMADVAVLSYVLGELQDPMTVIRMCWEAVALLIIIEPGTPNAFQLMRKVRRQLIDLKAHIMAPCPHALACPMQGTDWCHFPARVERTRLHRLLKEGSLGYEDEKFCYLIASKRPGTSFAHRIIRSPLKQSGQVRLTLCTDRGEIEEQTVSRKEGELYRLARHSEWGGKM